MVQINFARSEVQCKVVYYGPAESGKTANLRSIHQRSPARVRGQLTSMSTDTDRTLFFDYLPLNLGAVAGIEAKINLYAVPYIEGQNAVRSLVLEGIDGVVFVASSSRSDLERNQEALANLRENLANQGRMLSDIPLVFQWNKADSPDAVSAKEMCEILNPEGMFSAPSVATTGEGVFACLKSITQQVLEIVSRMMVMGKATMDEAPEPEPAPVPEPTPEPVPVPEPIAAPEPVAAAAPAPSHPAFEEVELPPEEPALPDEEFQDVALPPEPVPHRPSWHRPPDETVPLPAAAAAPAPEDVHPDLTLPGDPEIPEPVAERPGADLGDEDFVPPAAVLSAARELEAESQRAAEPEPQYEPEPEPEPVEVASAEESEENFPAFGGATLESSPRMVRVGGPGSQSPVQAGWDQAGAAADLKSRYQGHAGQDRAGRSRDARPVTERRRRPRIADMSHVVPASYFVAGAACALISLVTIGYLVHAFL
jgi:signal recognition particle receptor subunit beta